MIKKSNKTFISLFLLILSLILVSCGDAPLSERELIESLNEVVSNDKHFSVKSYVEHDNYEVTMPITDLIIDKRQTTEIEDEIFCTVIQSNEYFSVKRELRLFYELYDQGWLYESMIEDDSEYSVTATSVPPQVEFNEETLLEAFVYYDPQLNSSALESGTITGFSDPTIDIIPIIEHSEEEGLIFAYVYDDVKIEFPPVALSAKDPTTTIALSIKGPITIKYEFDYSHDSYHRSLGTWSTSINFENMNGEINGQPYFADYAIDWENPDFENAVRQLINKPEGDIMRSELLGIIECLLTENTVALSQEENVYTQVFETTDLTSVVSDLHHFNNLTTLHMEAASITDFTPLAGLTNLSVLRLSSIPITDITPLVELTNLTELSLGGLILQTLHLL